MLPLNEYQQLIFNLLKEGINKAKVYDDVPKNAKLPLIVLGDYTLATGILKNDSYTIIQTVNIYSDYEGKKEINELVTAAISNVSKIFNININENWVTTSLRLQESEVVRTEDIYIATLKFQIEIENEKN